MIILLTKDERPERVVEYLHEMLASGRTKKVIALCKLTTFDCPNLKLRVHKYIIKEEKRASGSKS